MDIFHYCLPVIQLYYRFAFPTYICCCHTVAICYGYYNDLLLDRDGLCVCVCVSVCDRVCLSYVLMKIIVMFTNIHHHITDAKQCL